MHRLITKVLFFFTLLVTSHSLYASKSDSLSTAYLSSSPNKIDLPIDYTATYAPQINHHINEQELHNTNLPQDVYTIASKLRGSSIFLLAILTDQDASNKSKQGPTKDEQKTTNAQDDDDYVQIINHSNNQLKSQEKVVYKKYLFPSQAIFPQKIGEIAHQLKYHIIQNNATHIMISLMEWLQKSRQSIYNIAISSPINIPICAKCEYLLAILGYKKIIHFHEKGCASKPFPWPLPLFAMQYLHKVILQLRNPLQVTLNILEKLSSSARSDYNEVCNTNKILLQTVEELNFALQKNQNKLLDTQKKLQQLIYRSPPLPKSLSGQDLAGFDFTGCEFTYTDLTNTKLANTILTYTRCDYRKAFQCNISKNGIYDQKYARKIFNDLASIAVIYPKLANGYKASLLHIACGFSRLPFYKKNQFYVKVSYWSCYLLILKEEINNYYGHILTCSLEPNLYRNATYCCWQTNYPQNNIHICTKAPHNNFTLYLKEFNSGLIQYKCSSKMKWGFDFYKSQIRKNIKELKKGHRKIKQKKLQEAMCDIAYRLSKTYQVQYLDLLFCYLYCQNCIIQIKENITALIKNRSH